MPSVSPTPCRGDLAALTEPLAVGRHAASLANRNLGPNIIVGCGPIGLAVLLALKDQGKGPIIAVDLSRERRDMARILGADVIIDPSDQSPYSNWQDVQFTPAPASPLLGRDFVGQPKGINIFECTGAGSVLKQITEEAPRHSHVIYAGVCTHEVKHVPVQATLRELTVEYCFAYTPQDFEKSLELIAAQPDIVARLVTSRVPLDAVEAAFDKLTGTPSEIKILIDVRG